MNIQEYISSGIVENYVLGLTDEKETAEFEKMCEAYPEIKAARDNFELSLEQQALMNAVPPPPQLKSKIFSEIEIETDKRRSSLVPVPNRKTEQTASAPNVKWLKYINVAALLLLLISVALNFYFLSKYRSYSARIDNLLSEQQKMTYNYNVLEEKNQAYSKLSQVVRDPDMVEVKMPAVPESPAPNSFATVYWGKKSKEVYLIVKAIPQPAPDKQYQLWAMVDGKPISAGLIELNTEYPIIKLSNIERAEGFAVTLENKGGSVEPNVEQMYMSGTIKT